MNPRGPHRPGHRHTDRRTTRGRTGSRLTHRRESYVKVTCTTMIVSPYTGYGPRVAPKCRGSVDRQRRSHTTNSRTLRSTDNSRRISQPPLDNHMISWGHAPRPQRRSSAAALSAGSDARVRARRRDIGVVSRDPCRPRDRRARVARVARPHA